MVPKPIRQTLLCIATISHSSTLTDGEYAPEECQILQATIRAELDRHMKHKYRFQRISKREDRFDMPTEMCKVNSRGRYFLTYRGCPIIKSPEDFPLYHLLFGHLKPRRVIELGTYGGGSAIWIADQLKQLDISAHIHSMDIDPSLLDEQSKRLKPENVTYLQGDNFKIENTFTPTMLAQLPNPWLLIEDSHVNVEGTLCYFHQFMKEGDYIVVEDTNPYIPKYARHMVTEFESYPLLGTEKLDKLKDFLFGYEETYAVDAFFTDFYGYNCSWMWHGFI